MKSTFMILIICLMLSACAGSSNKVAVVQEEDNGMSCPQIEKEINYLRDERKTALNSVFYTNRDLIDSTTQRIRYLKTMYYYGDCSKENQKYTNVILAGL